MIANKLISNGTFSRCWAGEAKDYCSSLACAVLGRGRGCHERGSDVSSSQKIGHKAALCLAAKEQALESSGYNALSFVIAIKVNDAKALYD